MHGDILNGDFILEPGQDISSFDLVDFCLSILVYEFINMHIATSNSHQYLIALFDFDVDSLLSKNVYTLTFSQEHDSHVRGFGPGVQELAQRLVDFVVFVSDVDVLALLEVGVDEA